VLIKRNEKTSYNLERFSIEGRDYRTFYKNVVTHPLFYFPFLTLTIMAYLPSFTNTKRQFEDFHMNYYMGPQGIMRTGRWAEWALAQFFSLKTNDIANKYLGMVFLILGALMIVCTFYCMSVNGGILKYTVFATMMTTFPLINEIWSYNLANIIVCLNYFLDGIVIYYLFVSHKTIKKKLIISSCVFTWMSASYESGILLYVTLILAILFYLVYIKINYKDYFKTGIICAVPLFIGFFAAVFIGVLISILVHTPYMKQGDTIPHWKEIGALRKMIIGNIDHYLLRGLVYTPISIFVIIAAVFFVYIIVAAFRKKVMLFVAGGLLLCSLFMLSLIQGSWFPYREAQNIAAFIGFASFFAFVPLENRKSLYVKNAVSAMLMFLCIISAAYLQKINLLDYQIAHNDEELVRQLGYDLIQNYYGKPVMFVGHVYDGTELYSSVIMDEINVNLESGRGHIYSKLYENIAGEPIPKKKYIDTNLYSTLFLANVEPESLEQYFSYCGYEITVIPYAEFSYPEVDELIAEKKLHSFEIVDMGTYVLVEL